MKYKVTEKHVYYKSGLILDDKQSGDGYELCDPLHPSQVYKRDIHLDNVEVWSKVGWIEEIQEKEFTRSDMLEFARYADGLPFINSEKYITDLKIWLESNNK